MAFSARVKVLSVGQVTDVLTGSLVYQVSFGRIGKPAAGIPVQGKEILSNALVVYFAMKGECPYKAGSEWTLKISDNGTMTLKP